MSKDAIQQAQLEDLAEKTYNMQQYFQEFTDMERGEYDGIHGFHPDPDGNEALQDDIFDFEQRLDNLREEIKDYALWLGEEEQ